MVCNTLNRSEQSLYDYLLEHKGKDVSVVALGNVFYKGKERPGGVMAREFMNGALFVALARRYPMRILRCLFAWLFCRPRTLAEIRDQNKTSCAVISNVNETTGSIRWGMR
jgi:hypothetical protein